LTDNTPDSLIPYDTIVQDALLTVVGRTLQSVVDAGGQMPGNHHFYITFDTRTPGVEIPDHLRQRFSEEMTIVLQHRFHSLETSETGFKVGLAFSNVPAMLSIPYSSITAFVDPSVDFVLRFNADIGDEADESPDDARSGDDSDEGNVVTVDFGKR